AALPDELWPRVGLALPRRRAACCAQTHGRAPRPNGVSPAPRAGGSPPAWCPVPACVVPARPHAVRCGVVKPRAPDRRGRRTTQGWQDSNLRPAGLESAALACLSYTPLPTAERRPTRSGGAASRQLLAATRVAYLPAPTDGGRIGR